jgi:hypothetical protein
MEFFTQLDAKRVSILCLEYCTLTITDMETTRNFEVETDKSNI